MSKTIVWGQTLYHPKTFKEADVRITSIHVDLYDMLKISMQEGVEMKTINIPMERGIDIGLINFDVLNKHLKI